MFQEHLQQFWRRLLLFTLRKASELNDSSARFWSKSEEYKAHSAPPCLWTVGKSSGSKFSRIPNPSVMFLYVSILWAEQLLSLSMMTLTVSIWYCSWLFSVTSCSIDSSGSALRLLTLCSSSRYDWHTPGTLFAAHSKCLNWSCSDTNHDLTDKWLWSDPGQSFAVLLHTVPKLWHKQHIKTA